jgi:short-subunit dehydrogenase
VLVLNAGMLGSLGAISAIDPKELARVLTLNVSAQAALLSAFDLMLRRSERGVVIGVTSTVGREARAYWGVYGASKAAFENLLLSYGDEVNGLGVRVALVNPGATRTAMRAHAYPGEDPATVKDPAVVGARIAALASEPFASGWFERVQA